MDKRYVKFKKLSKNLTYKQIGDGEKPRISAERVRQIINPKKVLKCLKHKVKHTDFCKYCLVETSYPTVLSVLSKRGSKNLKIEFDRLSKQDRSGLAVLQRTILIKFMKDNLKFSLTRIAFILKRDYSSIKNLYQKVVSK